MRFCYNLCTIQILNTVPKQSKLIRLVNKFSGIVFFFIILQINKNILKVNFSLKCKWKHWSTSLKLIS